MQRLLAAIPSERTHGRWPWVSALAAGPATVLALRRSERLREDGSWVAWLPLVALLWHQSEEWVWPAGFLPWMNREVLGSQEDEFPIDRPLGLAINSGMGWAVGIAAGALGRPAVSSLQLTLIAGNAAMHLGQAARTRTRNPGLLTSLLLFAPLSLAGFRSLLARPAARRPVLAGALSGAAASLALPLAMKLRLRRRDAR